MRHVDCVLGVCVCLYSMYIWQTALVRLSRSSGCLKAAASTYSLPPPKMELAIPPTTAWPRPIPAPAATIPPSPDAMPPSCWGTKATRPGAPQPHVVSTRQRVRFKMRSTPIRSGL